MQSLKNVQSGITRAGDSDDKTANAKRTIPITPSIREIIEAETGDPWIFGDGSKKPTMNALKLSFQRLQKKLPDMRITLYSFRTTFATRAARAGMQPKALQHIMGHSDIKTTLQHYIRVGKDDLSAAGELMEKLL